MDAGALHEAAEHAAQNAVTIELRADPDVENPEPGSAAVAPASTAFDALGWLISPTEGIMLTGAWSRRITEEHRLVYLLDGDDLVILQARFHYE